jgi:calcium-translocating P-type ATPase
VQTPLTTTSMTVKDEESPLIKDDVAPEASTEGIEVDTNGKENTNGNRSGSSRGFYTPDTRFGGFAGVVEASVASSIDQNLGNVTAPYPVTASDLGLLSQERNREALANLLEKGIGGKQEVAVDTEAPSREYKLQKYIAALVSSLRNPKSDEEQDTNADLAANIITSVVLRSSPETGIDPREVEHRREVFGSNAIADKELESFCKLCFEAVQDFVLIMLIVLGIISIVVEVTTLEEGETCNTCWIEGCAILLAVLIVVLVTASIDYAKQFHFIRLTRSLNNTNTKAVIRDGHTVLVADDDIVVGDILSINSHSLASIPADCVLLGPAADLKMDESPLTGESRFISKRPGDIVLSGTTAVQGNGKLIVIAVGTNSVAGKIKAQVYDSSDHDGDLDGDDENSPLFVKLDLIAKRIGVAGTVAAIVAFVGSCVIGLAIRGDDVTELVTYLVTAITVLAVAVPEGLPLAVTLALAFSSNKMMKEQNLVKHLDACETMGCATTICTDKTGTYLIPPGLVHSTLF